MTDENRVFKLRLFGFSPHVIAEQCGCTIADVSRIVDQRLPALTPEFRLQAMPLDLERLDRMTVRCLEAMEKGSFASGHLLIKAMQRRAEMLGTDAPQRIDASLLIEVTKPESSTENLRRVFAEMREYFGRQRPEPPHSLPN